MPPHEIYLRTDEHSVCPARNGLRPLSDRGWLMRTDKVRMAARCTCDQPPAKPHQTSRWGHQLFALSPGHRPHRTRVAKLSAHRPLRAWVATAPTLVISSGTTTVGDSAHRITLIACIKIATALFDVGEICRADAHIAYGLKGMHATASIDSIKLHFRIKA